MLDRLEEAENEPDPRAHEEEVHDQGAVHAQGPPELGKQPGHGDHDHGERQGLHHRTIALAAIHQHVRSQQGEQGNARPEVAEHERSDTCDHHERTHR
jgi:hypothetical protein